MDITLPFEEGTNLDALFVAQEGMEVDNSSPTEILPTAQSHA